MLFASKSYCFHAVLDLIGCPVDHVNTGMHLTEKSRQFLSNSFIVLLHCNISDWPQTYNVSFLYTIFIKRMKFHAISI